jgi:hypothetical protein
MIALVIGGAVGAIDEFHEALAMVSEKVVTLAVNDQIMLFPYYIDHAVTLHPEKLDHIDPKWLTVRRSHHLDDPGEIWAHRDSRRTANIVTKIEPDHWQGSSGLYAARIAMRNLGLRVILCGVPMQAQRSHVVRGRPWNAVAAFTASWQKYLPQMRPYVRSMSGWTCSLLGFPDQEFLNGPDR